MSRSVVAITARLILLVSLKSFLAHPLISPPTSFLSAHNKWNQLTLTEPKRNNRVLTEINKNDFHNSLPHVDNVDAFKSAVAAVVVATVLVLLLPFPAQSTDVDNEEEVSTIISRGSTLFTQNCAGCHAGGQNFIREKKTLKKEALTKFLGPQLDGDTVKNFFINSGYHQQLQFFRLPGGKLSDSQSTDVSSFIADQALGDKW